ncbi:hypothetical protein CTAYLR_005959 [Chrysophaeum taylorii]|uniref:Amino acid transporter transmembrane domain-containing protein n=1 Tax=Chrysophaeum taylorii TaxID=2483200 RepID=A0AAD7UIT8_9STRA|nr:hypothetical protein CTAYLR_005959 [Chrysophaeum taylorii]
MQQLPSSPLIEEEEEKVRTYGSLNGFAVVLNYIIGTGCFGLPYAFHAAGLGTTSLCVVIGAAMTSVSVTYVLEAMARAEGLRVGAWPPRHRVANRKYDFATMGRVFGGIPGKIVVQLTLLFYCGGALWSYASVFGSTAASMSFGCDVYRDDTCLPAYSAWTLVFGGVVSALALADLGDQSVLQSWLTLYRIIALVLMLTTMGARLANSPREPPPALFRGWRRAASGFGPSILAITVQYCLPDAVQPLADKRAATAVTYAALLVSAVFYLALGIMGALTFRDTVNPLASLNWTTFTACGHTLWDACPQNASFARVAAGCLVRLVVLLFPAINVFSVYPLVAVTMGNNIATAGIPRVPARLLAAVPPLLCALVFQRLDRILSIAGLLGFVLGLTVPAYFQIESLKLCLRTWGCPSRASVLVTPEQQQQQAQQPSQQQPFSESTTNCLCCERGPPTARPLRHRPTVPQYTATVVVTSPESLLRQRRDTAVRTPYTLPWIPPSVNLARAFFVATLVITLAASLSLAADLGAF